MTLPRTIDYRYNARVINVIDGDTVDVDIDLGFRIRTTTRIRLYGINAPELRGPDKERGLAAKNLLIKMVLGKDVILETRKDCQEKYGRFLATIYVDGSNVNQFILESGLAIAYMEM